MKRNYSLSRYRIRQKISTGGTATVFLADDLQLDREVALKMMHPYLQNRQDAIYRFSIEAKALASLSHQNIIHIFDYGEHNNCPFLVMEYIDGMNLQQLLDSRGSLPNLVTIAIVRQIASGLVCAHKNGIIHRDIKPANILLDKNGIIRITDFGIAYLENTVSSTGKSQLVGSPYFISPEQAKNGSLTSASDVFSLGILLYFCLTGMLPFKGSTPNEVIDAILSKNPVSIRRKNKSVLIWLAVLAENCLKKTHSERPTVSEILKTIDKHCKTDSLRIKRSIIADFQNNSYRYRAREIDELVHRYYRSAAKDFFTGRINSAIRKKKQADLLANSGYIKESKKGWFLKFALSASVLILLASTFIHFSNVRNSEKRILLPLHKHETKSVSAIQDSSYFNTDMDFLFYNFDSVNTP